MPPAAVSSSPDPAAPSFDQVYPIYWKAKNEYARLGNLVASTASPTERAALQNQRSKLEEQLLQIESHARSAGYYHRLIQKPPGAPMGGAHQPQAAAARQTLAQLRETVSGVNYAGPGTASTTGYYPRSAAGASYYDPGRPADTAHVAVPAHTGERAILELKEVPAYTMGMANAATRLTQADRDNFRELQAPPGISRILTQALHGALALAVQGGASIFATRLMAGDTFFDIGRPRTDKDDEWEDES